MKKLLRKKVTRETTVKAEGQKPEPEAELVWKSPRVIVAILLALLIVWWRVRNGGELSEALDDGLSIFNTVAMGTSLVGVLVLLRSAVKDSKPITMDPKKALPKEQPPVITATSTETTTTTTTTPVDDGGTK